MVSSHVDWVQRSTGLTLNSDQSRCVDVLCSFSQPYNLQLIGDGWRTAAVETWDESDGDWDAPPLLRPVSFGEKYLIVHLLGSLATFDFSELTRLVLAGHEHAVRAEISPQVYRWVDTDGDYVCECPVEVEDDQAADVDETAAVRAVRSEQRADQLRSLLTEHQDGCRYGEHPTGPGACLRLALHARDRERHPTTGHNWDWHPTIERAAGFEQVAWRIGYDDGSGGVPREMDDPAWPVPMIVEGEGFVEPLYRRRRRG